MKIITKIFAITFITILFFACSKDKKIEKTLYKKDGVWNVSSVEYTYTNQNLTTLAQTVLTGTAKDAGTFTFSKDGDVSYDFTFEGRNKTGTYNYTVSDGSISVTSVSQSVSLTGTAGFDQKTTTYTGTQTSDTQIDLSGTETIQNTDSQTVFVGTFVLIKQ